MAVKSDNTTSETDAGKLLFAACVWAESAVGGLTFTAALTERPRLAYDANNPARDNQRSQHFK